LFVAFPVALMLRPSVVFLWRYVLWLNGAS